MLPDDRMSNVASILARLIEVRKRQSGGSWRVHGARGIETAMQLLVDRAGW